jgi:hypothetical protein
MYQILVPVSPFQSVCLLRIWQIQLTSTEFLVFSYASQAPLKLGWDCWLVQDSELEAGVVVPLMD